MDSRRLLLKPAASPLGQIRRLIHLWNLKQPS
jgi:hypothetical protein